MASRRPTIKAFKSPTGNAHEFTGTWASDQLPSDSSGTPFYGSLDDFESDTDDTLDPLVQSGQPFIASPSVSYADIVKGTVVPSKRPYPCEQCDQRFLYPKDLKRHLASHTGERSFVCVCNSAYSRADNLIRHQRNCESFQWRSRTSPTPALPIDVTDPDNLIQKPAARGSSQAGGFGRGSKNISSTGPYSVSYISNRNTRGTTPSEASKQGNRTQPKVGRVNKNLDDRQPVCCQDWRNRNSPPGDRCDRRFPRPSDLYTHLRETHNFYFCTSCFLSFNDLPLFQNKETNEASWRNHESEYPHLCKRCATCVGRGLRKPQHHPCDDNLTQGRRYLDRVEEKWHHIYNNMFSDQVIHNCYYGQDFVQPTNTGLVPSVTFPLQTAELDPNIDNINNANFSSARSETSNITRTRAYSDDHLAPPLTPHQIRSSMVDDWTGSSSAAANYPNQSRTASAPSISSPNANTVQGPYSPLEERQNLGSISALDPRDSEITTLRRTMQEQMRNFAELTVEHQRREQRLQQVNQEQSQMLGSHSRRIETLEEILEKLQEKLTRVEQELRQTGANSRLQQPSHGTNRMFQPSPSTVPMASDSNSSMRGNDFLAPMEMDFQVQAVTAISEADLDNWSSLLSNTQKKEAASSTHVGGDLLDAFR